MKECYKWNGEYKGIPFEINTFLLDKTDQWTFYLFIRESQFSKKIFERFWLPPSRQKNYPQRIFYLTMDEPLINDICWHGGCTWYQKVAGFDGSKRIIKIGCDYGHSFDRNKRYYVDDIYADVKAAIDSLHRLVQGINYWCCKCGHWGRKGYVSEGDAFVCGKCAKEAHDDAG